ncbi:hypothetical protein A2973_01665 [Candidatus Gottesmanbacteria bacterium RIFCSPLOWO2_01_FULL_49_10]|uniref:Uncharacterized protein n=1 Tax=Candidatus Gottesmanbacteria bacterium RIFCSPLOWO2_01_FULL_49_10 TaxID=1798396 RepID=A0A1F6AWW3_9BACT|nr:MAG: hypothetical protein UY10_C0012G0013 [Microgenomates group bacterium GW2011_GWA2_47_8]OGG29175.1 MAG: hypothetical protein A2973_01665 [Candidatus Gottesmanbacteria bacterium RIFCSPLOWO2_01_FULL_49_10]
MQMKRYQMYLEPKSVAIIDDLSRELDISRSQIVRDVISRVMREYEKILTAATSRRLKNNPLLQMAGFAQSPTGHVSENIDDIYLHD